MVSRPYTMSELVLAITLTWMNWFWLFFGKNVTESKLWNRCVFPPHITSSSVLCGKTGNLEIASFHLNASCSFVNTQHNKKLSYRRGTARCVSTVLTVDGSSAMTIWHFVHFYRAMLCIRSTSHGPVSDCLCLSQVGVLLKRLNVGWHNQNHTIAQGL